MMALLAATTIVVSFLPTPIVRAALYTDINANTAHQAITSGLYQNLVILDVRTREEFDQGHIRMALLIPHAELEERIGELAEHKNHPIIVYCFCGMRSAIASSILAAHGFTKVYNMMDGLNAWMGQGYPITTSYTTQFFLSINPNPARTTEYITLKGILTDQFSQPIATQNVKLYYREYYNCKTWRFVSTISTNAYGAFLATGKIGKAGIYEVAVYYPGSAYREPSYQLTILLVLP
jgi:rhodanese-related sulfurtransferase